MAFLDNSGDIILDAVLTDTGRKRLARGDGSFRISKFCLHDDEINYELYNTSHASGSAYYDLEILQTPLLEAFTNNTSGMKHKLINISRTNLLYLPEMILHTGTIDKSAWDQIAHQVLNSQTFSTTNQFMIAVDQTTLDRIYDAAGNSTNNSAAIALANDVGILNGYNPGTNNINHAIEVHQGINASAKPDTVKIDPSLEETQYIIEMDNRLGALRDVEVSATAINPTFIDDDDIASYFLTNSTMTGFTSLSKDDSNNSYPYPHYSQLLGSRGSAVCFKIKASIELETSTYLFTLLGSEATIVTDGEAENSPSTESSTYYYIDSTIRITGGTTGYSLEIPVRYIKYKS